jgi:hypothetical protein
MALLELGRTRLATCLGAVALFLASSMASPVRAWSPSDFFSPCENDCAFSVFGGDYVENSLGQVIVTKPQPPLTWDYHTDDHIIATAFSRRTRLYWGHVDFEPEIGIGQRFGQQNETEVWAALFFRYHGFPWDKYVITTIAASTGLNWASDVSEVEQERAHDGEGSQLMHYFAPEVTFALPSAPNSQLFLRMHHRSGVFGLVSDAWGGAQYGTIGVRIWF